LSKPTEELIALLGIETPIAPTLSLTGIKADGIALHWKAADQKGSGIRHSLYINGMKGESNAGIWNNADNVVGDISPQDSPIAVTGLQPDHGYIVRMFAVNSLNFVATSEEILVKTKTASSGDFYAADADSAAEIDGSGPKVKPYKALLETIGSPQASSPSQQRERSGSLSHSNSKRGAGRRQTNPVETTTLPPTSAPRDNHDMAESSENIRELTGRLDEIRAEAESFEMQIHSEKERFQQDHEAMNMALKDAQQQLRDKNDASRKLTQQVAALVSEESAARKTKTQVDKQLQTAVQERERVKRDLSKWESEAESIEEKIRQLATDEEEYKEKSAKDVVDLKKKLVDETAVNKTMEEKIRQMMGEIKEVEEEAKRLETEAAVEDASAVEAESEWRVRMTELQNTYSYMLNQLTLARSAAQMATATLDHWKQYFYTHQAAQAYPQPLVEILPASATSPRRDSLRRRAPSLSMRGSIGAPGDERSPPTSHAEMTGSGGASVSPNFGTIGPFFNITNGMTIPPAASLPMSPDVDQLIGGAPTSPSAADNLLPSGLFGDDVESLSKFDDSGLHLRAPSLSAPMESPSPLNIVPVHNPNVLPGLGAPETLEELGQLPSSPNSIQSRSQSVSAFTSPRESLTHLPGTFGSGLDPDRRSIRSMTAASSNRSGKFANFFHLGRQRGKPGSDEGPALGALKNSESFGFPKDSDSIAESPTLDVPASSAFSFGKGRRGSHTGLPPPNGGSSWVGQMLGRANTDQALVSAPGAVAVPSKRRFVIFNTGKDAVDEISSSQRPPSTTSLDATHASSFPRPGVDTQFQSRFGWPIHSSLASHPVHTEATASGASSSSHLVGTDWSVYSGPSRSGWGSRLHSRTSSSVQGHHSSLQLPTSTDDSDFDFLTPNPNLAPIGTRPKSAHHVSTGSYSSSSNEVPVYTSTPPRLNPAATPFKLFGSSASASKNESNSTPSKRSLLRPGPLSPRHRKTASQASIDDSALPSPLPPLDSPIATSSRSKDGAGSLASSVIGDGSDLGGRESIDSGREGQKESFMQKVARKGSQSLGTLALPAITKSGKKSKASKEKGRNKDKDKTVGDDAEDVVAVVVEGATDDEVDGSVVEENGTPKISQAVTPGSQSPAVGGSQKGFKFRSFRRRKGDKNSQSVSSIAASSMTGEDEDVEMGDGVDGKKEG
jgi:hypothetical protein